jgi:hypothetical protein
MTIIPADFPEAARRAVLHGMHQRAATRGFWTPKLKHADPTTLQLVVPHRLALLPLSRMQQEVRRRATASDKLPPRPLAELASILGWRFLIINDKHEPIAAAHAFQSRSGEYRLAELNEGIYIERTLTAYQMPFVTDAISRKIDGDTFEELLLLIAPALYFTGLWVRYEQRDKDFILPLDDSYLPGFERAGAEKLILTLLDASITVPSDSHSAG